MSRAFKIFLLVALSFLLSFNLSANDTFFSTEKSSDRLEELAKAGSKLVDKLDLGGFVKKIGDYDVYDKGEVFYRGMKKTDYEKLLKGELHATSETFTSPTLKYVKAGGYGSNADEIIIKFQMKKGTLDDLLKIGVRDNAKKTRRFFNKLPEVKSVDNWKTENALFKTEGSKYVKSGVLEDVQVNIGLGTGKALKKFNKNIISFEIVK